MGLHKILPHNVDLMPHLNTIIATSKKEKMDWYKF